MYRLSIVLLELRENGKRKVNYSTSSNACLRQKNHVIKFYKMLISFQRSDMNKGYEGGHIYVLVVLPKC